MEIKVTNCPDRKFIKYIKKAIHFYDQELLINRRISSNCYLHIKFDQKLDHYGSCEVSGFNSKNEPRVFLIMMHPGLGARKILETLAHEMVHIKQLINKETNYTFQKWKGEIVDENIDYWDLPWELEAFGKEYGLSVKFAHEEKLWLVFEEFSNPDEPLESIGINWRNGNNKKS